MDDVELVGGVLFDSTDPDASARVLATLLLADKADAAQARQAGFEPVLVESLRRYLPRDPQGIDTACACGAAWVRGRRSAEQPDRWEVVASVPNVMSLPAGLRRTTGETLIGLVTGAERVLRIAAPYVDEAGIRFLSDAIVAASRRQISVEVFEPRWSTPAKEAISRLEAQVRAAGDIRRLHRVRSVIEAPFSHLKVVVADNTAAYIGSANLTDAALTGRNLELGVLVRGSQVAVVNALLDLYRER